MGRRSTSAGDIRREAKTMRRRTMIGLVAGVIGSVAAGAAAFAATGHGRDMMMRRMAVAAIDGALDDARTTPEQRTAIHAARDRVFAAVAEHRKGRHARLDDMLALFESDGLGERLPALRQQIESEHEKIAAAIGAALVDAHAVLTPAQRKTVAEYVRSHRHTHP
jgi:Spy/CpxP family protein refolding chaperone